MNLTINGQPISVPPGTTIWDAAQQHGIEIPVLCHSPKLDPVGVCRMCVVDVGGRVLVASCVRPCEEGMTVEMHSPRVEKQRKMLTAMLLADHPVPCAKEKTTGDDLLDAMGRRYGLLDEKAHHFAPSKRPLLSSDRRRSSSLYPLRPLHPCLRRHPVQRGDRPHRQGLHHSHRLRSR